MDDKLIERVKVIFPKDKSEKEIFENLKQLSDYSTLHSIIDDIAPYTKMQYSIPLKEKNAAIRMASSLTGECIKTLCFYLERDTDIKILKLYNEKRKLHTLVAGLNDYDYCLKLIKLIKEVLEEI